MNNHKKSRDFSQGFCVENPLNPCENTNGLDISVARSGPRTDMHGIHKLGRVQELLPYGRLMQILGPDAELTCLTVLTPAQGLPSLLAQEQGLGRDLHEFGQVCSTARATAFTAKINSTDRAL
jgi:hypothetical protein